MMAMLEQENKDEILYHIVTVIRNDNVDMLKLMLDTFPKITRDEKEEFLSISVNSNSQKCFNYLYEIGINSYELMQYTSNYQDFLKMKKNCN